MIPSFTNSKKSNLLYCFGHKKGGKEIKERISSFRFNVHALSKRVNNSYQERIVLSLFTLLLVSKELGEQIAPVALFVKSDMSNSFFFKERHEQITPTLSCMYFSLANCLAFFPLYLVSLLFLCLSVSLSVYLSEREFLCIYMSLRFSICVSV